MFVHIYKYYFNLLYINFDQTSQLRSSVMYFIIQNYAEVKNTSSFALLPLTVRADIRRNLPTHTQAEGDSCVTM